MTKKSSNELSPEAISQALDVLNKTTLLPTSADYFFTACQLVANTANIKLNTALTSLSNKNYRARLEEFSQKSNFRFREILLEGNWWEQDNGSLLGFTTEGEQPCALLQEQGQYYLIIPSENKRISINKDNADLISPTVYYFYNSLAQTKLSVKDLITFAYFQNKQDLRRVLGMQLLISLIALIIPIATGYLFSTAIPYADKNALVQIIIALVVSAFIGAAFQLVQVISIFRVKFKSNVTVQAALWDRVLRFPVSFFHAFQAGDLTTRINAIDSIQQALTMHLLLSFSNSVLVVFSIIFLFFLAPILTIFLFLALLLIGLVSFILTLRQVHYLRQYFHLIGETYSLLLQLFSSINKIRVSHNENSMFLFWLGKFCRKTFMFYKSGNLAVSIKVINTICSLFITLGFYAYMILNYETMTLGVFIMYNAAFIQLTAAFVGIWSSINQLTAIIPIYERSKPILDTLPENSTKEGLRFSLKGKVEFRDLSFQYPNNELPICDDLTLKINPGEYVGILGKSGVGKSSLVRLLLGFEQPDSGSVLFDDHDLSIMNLSHLRNQLGVIFQHSLLMPGSLESNIIGNHSQYTIEDAWNAAKLANIDQEIKKMPMGMKTIISERSGSLSVGQRQRVLIARALVKNPKILIFDEAMSGMDDETMAFFQACIESLKVTRIVITQRPTFLKNADRIYILDKGKIAAKGNYTELHQLKLFDRFKISKEE